jgi:hypothetical protein
MHPCQSNLSKYSCTTNSQHKYEHTHHAMNKMQISGSKRGARGLRRRWRWRARSGASVAMGRPGAAAAGRSGEPVAEAGGSGPHRRRLRAPPSGGVRLRRGRARGAAGSSGRGRESRRQRAPASASWARSSGLRLLLRCCRGASLPPRGWPRRATVEGRPGRAAVGGQPCCASGQAFVHLELNVIT